MKQLIYGIYEENKDEQTIRRQSWPAWLDTDKQEQNRNERPAPFVYSAQSYLYHINQHLCPTGLSTSAIIKAANDELTKHIIVKSQADLYHKSQPGLQAFRSVLSNWCSVPQPLVNQLMMIWQSHRCRVSMIYHKVNQPFKNFERFKGSPGSVSCSLGITISCSLLEFSLFSALGQPCAIAQALTWSVPQYIIVAAKVLKLAVKSTKAKLHKNVWEVIIANTISVDAYRPTEEKKVKQS